jgi:hypothetical protein
LYAPPASGTDDADTTVLAGAIGKSVGKSPGSSTATNSAAAVSITVEAVSGEAVESAASAGALSSGLPHPVVRAKLMTMAGRKMDMRMDGERTRGRSARQAPPDVWTIGHSTMDLDALLGLLKMHGVVRLADVRRYPASRKNPQFNRETLAAFLDARGIEYRWFEELGGRRGEGPAENSPNSGIENSGFRGYADYAGTQIFREALDALIAWARERPTAIMCAEALWWRCHRRLIADQLVARHGQVFHIFGDGSHEPHRLWDLARPAGDGLVYPPEQGELGLGPPPKAR